MYVCMSRRTAASDRGNSAAQQATAPKSPALLLSFPFGGYFSLCSDIGRKRDLAEVLRTMTLVSWSLICCLIA